VTPSTPWPSESERRERDSVTPEPQPEELPRRPADDRGRTSPDGTVDTMLLLGEDA